MAQIIPIKHEGWDPKRQQFRRDVEDLLQRLLIKKESELGPPVPRSVLLPIDPAQLVPELGARVEKVQELGGVALGNPWTERDVRVPGLFDRRAKLIVIAQNQPVAEQRYTVAHELGHLLYHTSPRHLRERAALVENHSARNVSPANRCEEREAEVFAAELLMPVDLMREAVVARFDGPIDGTLPHDTLAHFLSASTESKFNASQLARMPQVDRAALFATAKSFGCRIFEPLIKQFGVSKQAMAIRLLELGWVS